LFGFTVEYLRVIDVEDLGLKRTKDGGTRSDIYLRYCQIPEPTLHESPWEN
jgi:hypothetical protein